jgi:1-aminocyclopropane-1-carboxylate deaminase
MEIDLEIHSPVDRIKDQLFDAKGIEVFLKRDDLIHPFISGNKWRKLKYILQKAQQEHKSRLVTFGGAYSNHLLAVSAAAVRFGFKAAGFVRGEEVDNDTLFFCRLHGMSLLFTDRDAYRDKPGLFEKHFGNDADAFFIDEGGASAEGALGCSELVAELADTYDHIFCACGTGTTAAGIINGLSHHHLNTCFNGIPVLKGGAFLQAEIKKYLKSPAAFKLHTDYHFGGYGKTDDRLIKFIKEFIASTGILIDPVYTGKMLFAVYNLAAQDYFKPGEKILAVHTGGVLGLMGMKEKFK